MAGTLAVILPVWQAGYPWGSDTWGHLQRAAYMGETIREYGLGEGIARSAWMPDWYMGDPTRVYYPPLATWTLGLLAAITGDVFAAYRLWVTAVFLILGLSVYRVGMQWGNNRWMAATGALLAVAAPYTLRTVFAEGNLPRGLALLPLPWIIWYSEQALCKKDIHHFFVLLAGFWLLAIIAHVMQALIFAIAISIYIAVRVLTNTYIPLRRGVVALIPIALGAALAGAYLLPAYSHAELHNVPYLPTAKVDLFSITLEALRPYADNIEAISVGLAGLALAALITLRTTQAHQKALLAMAIFSVLLAFGPAGGLFQLLPIRGQLLPERFLNVSALAVPLLIAATPRGVWKPHWALAVLGLALIIDASPALRVVHMRPAPPDEEAIARTMAERPLPGRVATLTLPNPRASQLFLNSEVGQRANVSGWALENTPHQHAIRRLLTAATQSPAYLERVLSLWNTDYILARFEDEPLARRVRDQLAFRPVAQVGDLALWERSAPSAFVQVLPENRMLIIGDNPTDWLFVFPFAAEGVYPDPAQYDPSYLNRFSVIGLTRLPDSADVEAALGDWVRRGNTLIVDLSGMGRIYGQGFTLFGVHAIPLALNGEQAVEWPSELSGLPATLPFTTAEGPWVGATYYGLDWTAASVFHNGEAYPLLGTRQVGDGQVWFVGLNLLYLLNQSGQHEAADALVDYMLSATTADRTLTLPALEANLLHRDSISLAFRYTHGTPVTAVLSLTYFPRWQARIDGAPAALGNHEHLMLLELPAGTHTVTLEYQPFGSPIAWMGWAVSGLGVGLAGVSFYRLRRRPPLSVDDRAGAFEDRLPQPKPTLPSEYVTCPNCDFRLAESGPPDSQSYPFNAIHCPICGFTLGGTDFVPGEAMRGFAREAAVRLWMRQAQLFEADLIERFGLTVDELFTPPSPGETPPPLPEAHLPSGDETDAGR